MRSSFRGIAVLVAIALGAIACSPTQNAPSTSAAASVAGVAPARGGTLTVVTDAQPATYDAHLETSPAALDLLAPEYSLLYRYDSVDPSHLVADLATGAISYST